MGSAAFSLAARRGRCKAVQRQCGLGRSVGLGEIKRRFSASQTRTAFSLSPYAGFLSFFRRLFLSFARKREKRPSGLKLTAAARKAVIRSRRGKAGNVPFAGNRSPWRPTPPVSRHIEKPLVPCHDRADNASLRGTAFPSTPTLSASLQTANCTLHTKKSTRKGCSFSSWLICCSARLRLSPRRRI